MFLVSVPRIFKIAMRASFSQTTSKVAREISAFCNLVETQSIHHWYVLKSNSSRDFEKSPFNQSWKLIAYRNTTKNKLLTKSLKVF